MEDEIEQEQPEVVIGIPVTKLKTVTEVRALEPAGNYRVKFQIENGDEIIESEAAYSAGDPYGFGPELDAWFAENEGHYEILPVLPEPEQTYVIAKTLPWSRMTDEEAEIMDAVMTGSSAKLRQMYNAAQYLDSSDPFFEVIRNMLADNLTGGMTRANELLAEG